MSANFNSEPQNIEYRTAECRSVESLAQRRRLRRVSLCLFKIDRSTKDSRQAVRQKKLTTGRSTKKAHDRPFDKRLTTGRIPYFDIRYSLFDIRYSLFQSFYFDQTGRFFGQRRCSCETTFNLSLAKAQSSQRKALKILIILAPWRENYLSYLRFPEKRSRSPGLSFPNACRGALNPEP